MNYSNSTQQSENKKEENKDIQPKMVSSGSNMVSTGSNMVSSGSNMVSTGSNMVSSGNNMSQNQKILKNFEQTGQDEMEDLLMQYLQQKKNEVQQNSDENKSQKNNEKQQKNENEQEQKIQKQQIQEDEYQDEEIVSDDENKKTLLIFDFDQTIVDQDTDEQLVQLTEEKKYPENISQHHNHAIWMKYMNLVCDFIHSQGKKVDDFKQLLESLALSPGIDKLFQFLAAKKKIFDVIVLSNGNHLFIDWILEKNNLKQVVDKVFSNRGYIDQQTNTIKISKYHSHQCNMCPSNLCKQTVLKLFINQRNVEEVKYKQMIYIGDGKNDLCPLFALKDSDQGFVRRGYALEKLLQDKKNSQRVRSKIQYYENAEEIILFLNKIK